MVAKKNPTHHTPAAKMLELEWTYRETPSKTKLAACAGSEIFFKPAEQVPF
jgi:hypothetical protein